MDHRYMTMHPLTWAKFKPYMRKYGTVYAEQRHNWRRRGLHQVCRKCGRTEPVEGVLPRMGCTTREDECQDRSVNA